MGGRNPSEWLAEISGIRTFHRKKVEIHENSIKKGVESELHMFRSNSVTAASALRLTLMGTGSMAPAGKGSRMPWGPSRLYEIAAKNCILLHLNRKGLSKLLKPFLKIKFGAEGRT
jgi:hypothetical protein